MKPKSKTFKAVDLFDRRRRIIFDKKSGEIIQYWRPEDKKADPEPGPEEPEDKNQLTLNL
jgi:hypothetical protein